MGLARRLGKATAVTAAAGTLGGALLLTAEAVAARTRRYAQPDMRLAMRTAIGEAAAPALRLVLLGDSSALGVGVGRVTDTVGGRLAELLAEGGRRVELSSVAVHGSRCEDLATQVSRALVTIGLRPLDRSAPAPGLALGRLSGTPGVAVILIGANDALHLCRPGPTAAHLAAAVNRLRDAGVDVVVGTCPDLGAVRAIAPPLRQLMAAYGRRVGRAQGAAVARAGGIPVDLAERTGAVFRADAGTLCEDGYHPSADGYRVWAHALFPSVAEAAGVHHGE